MAKIVELIETEERRGRGVEGEPFRIVYQLWTKDGRLVLDYDQWSEARLIERCKELEESLRRAQAEKAAAALAFLEGEYLEGRGVPHIRGWKACMEHLIRKARTKAGQPKGD